MPKEVSLKTLCKRRMQFLLRLAEVCRFDARLLDGKPILKDIERQVAAIIGCTPDCVGNVRRCFRHFHSTSVEQLRSWAISRTKKAAELNFACLLNPTHPTRGSRRSRTAAPQVVAMKTNRLRVVLPAGYRSVLIMSGSTHRDRSIVLEAVP